MNATLQCMLSIEELTRYFMDHKFTDFHEYTTVSNKNEYSRKLAEFFHSVYDSDLPEDKVLNPTMLKNLIRKRFIPIMQHDSHEFLMHLMSML